jgi:hypothetical protein
VIHLSVGVLEEEGATEQKQQKQQKQQQQQEQQQQNEVIRKFFRKKALPSLRQFVKDLTDKANLYQHFDKIHQKSSTYKHI